MRTCWRALATFRQIGAAVLDRYDRAAQVRVRRVGTRTLLARVKEDATGESAEESAEATDENRGSARRRHASASRSRRNAAAVAEGDLVYVDQSPDYCEPRVDGWSGTHGRPCNRTGGGEGRSAGEALDACELLCCGRGFNTRRVTVVERCRCSFKWCCYVGCQKCTHQYDQHFCR